MRDGTGQQSQDRVRMSGKIYAVLLQVPSPNIVNRTYGRIDKILVKNDGQNTEMG